MISENTVATREVPRLEDFFRASEKNHGAVKTKNYIGPVVYKKQVLKLAASV